jgi:hypothetical protein
VQMLLTTAIGDRDPLNGIGRQVASKGGSARGPECLKAHEIRNTSFFFFRPCLDPLCELGKSNTGMRNSQAERSTWTGVPGTIRNKK